MGAEFGRVLSEFFLAFWSEAGWRAGGWRAGWAGETQNAGTLAAGGGGLARRPCPTLPCPAWPALPALPSVLPFYCWQAFKKIQAKPFNTHLYHLLEVLGFRVKAWLRA